MSVKSDGLGSSQEERVRVLDALLRLNPAQFDDLLFRVGHFNSPYMSGRQAPPATRAVELIQLVEPGHGLGGLVAALRKVGGSVAPAPVPPPAPAPRASGPWGVFIAHAGPDKALAAELYDHLDGRCAPFLDAKCIPAGDDWPPAIGAALRASRITAVLVSGRAPAAYYLQEEVTQAIAQARERPEWHRVVPVGTAPGLLSSEAVPYGLRIKQGLDAVALGGMKGVADALLKLLTELGRVGG